MTNPDRNDRSHDEQPIYTRTTLSLYDFVVLGISNSMIWLVAFYTRSVAGGFKA
jgi:hypothetical protein